MRCLEKVKKGRGDIDLVCIEGSILYIIEYKRINTDNGYNHYTGTDPYKARKELERQVIDRAELVIHNLEYILQILEEKFNKRPIITSVEIYGVEFERRKRDMIIRIMYLRIVPGKKPKKRFRMKIVPYFVRDISYENLEALLRKYGIKSFIEIIEKVGYKGKTIIKEIPAHLLK